MHNLQICTLGALHCTPQRSAGDFRCPAAALSLLQLPAQIQIPRADVAWPSLRIPPNASQQSLHAPTAILGSEQSITSLRQHPSCGIHTHVSCTWEEAFGPSKHPSPCLPYTRGSALSFGNLASSLVRCCEQHFCCCPAVVDAKCHAVGKHVGRCWSCLATILLTCPLARLDTVPAAEPLMSCLAS